MLTSLAFLLVTSFRGKLNWPKIMIVREEEELKNAENHYESS